MADALESAADAAKEEFAAPDGAVIAESGAVKAHTQNALVPLAAFGEHRSHMCAMMLHGNFVPRGQSYSVRRR